MMILCRNFKDEISDLSRRIYISRMNTAQSVRSCALRNFAAVITIYSLEQGAKPVKNDEK